jgi:hypothetical protein
MRRHVPWILLLVLAATALPTRAGSADGVTVTLSQQAYAQGDVVTVTIENATGKTLFVPGCHPFEVQGFKEEAYARVPREPCTSEGVAKALEPGTHELSYTTGEAEGAGIFRISVVYGWGCAENTPLGRARCEDFATVLSGSFRVGG